MGMSTHVTAMKDPNDPTHVRMMRELREHVAAGTEKLPPELDRYFGWDEPEGALEGAEEVLYLNWPEAGLREYQDSGRGHVGIEIDVDKIPAHTKVLRFYVSF